MNVLWSHTMLTDKDHQSLCLFLRGVYLAEIRAICSPLISMTFQDFSRQCRRAQQNGHKGTFSVWLPESLKLVYQDGTVSVASSRAVIKSYTSSKRELPED